MNIFYAIKPVYLFLLSAALLLPACAGQQAHTKSSVMDYLYPKSDAMSVTPSVPQLNLPLRVGVAFVPESSDRTYTRNAWNGDIYQSSISEAKKSELLEKVADNFRGLEFISSIEVIPSAYLTPEGGFANLSQIQTMYGIDVIALVSYDQVQFTDEGLLSLSYWTIVGAYVVSGEKNDTSTLMDTVVYDISSRTMLFRAPGTSTITGNSTPVNLSEELRTDSIRGFEKAADNMVPNLQNQLAVFKESIKNNPEKAQISHREGYSGGGGAFGVVEIAFLVLVTFFYRLARELTRMRGRRKMRRTSPSSLPQSSAS